jgi:hypothetical protein
MFWLDHNNFNESSNELKYTKKLIINSKWCTRMLKYMEEKYERREGSAKKYNDNNGYFNNYNNGDFQRNTNNYSKSPQNNRNSIPVNI